MRPNRERRLFRWRGDTSFVQRRTDLGEHDYTVERRLGVQWGAQDYRQETGVELHLWWAWVGVGVRRPWPGFVAINVRWGRHYLIGGDV